jgi:hypothetical protein
MSELVSKRTRKEFEDYFVEMTVLRQIERYFDNHDIAPKANSEDKISSSQRRNLVQSYYNTINWTNPISARKILDVYGDVLDDLQNKTDFSTTTEVRLKWIEILTRALKKDGYRFDGKKISIQGKVEFDNIEKATDVLDKTHFQEYVDRIKNSIDMDPGLAIGSAKELVEATLKTILKELGVGFDKNDDIPKLLKAVQKSLDLVPDDIDNAKVGAEHIKVLLNNLGSVVIKTAELRNLYGTGHGADRKRKGLSSRHARLIVGAAVTLSAFLLETFDLKRLK